MRQSFVETAQLKVQQSEMRSSGRKAWVSFNDSREQVYRRALLMLQNSDHTQQVQSAYIFWF